MSIAFFDFDETVITGKSMFLFLQEYSCHYRLQCGLSFDEIMEKIYVLKKKEIYVKILTVITIHYLKMKINFK